MAAIDNFLYSMTTVSNDIGDPKILGNLGPE